jgi:DNA-binding MarR family transcriptional regulator
MKDSSTEVTRGEVPELGCALPQAAAGRLAFMLAVLGSRIEELAEVTLPGLGLDGHDYTVLAILSADGPDTQHEIARLMNKAPGVVVAAVDQLEAKGLVERQRDPADRRRSRVTPTRTGIAALKKADGAGEQILADALPMLSSDELEMLRELLERGVGLPTAQAAAGSGAG